jgi:hypothetical protein
MEKPQGCADSALRYIASGEETELTQSTKSSEFTEKKEFECRDAEGAERRDFSRFFEMTVAGRRVPGGEEERKAGSSPRSE